MTKRKLTIVSIIIAAILIVSLTTSVGLAFAEETAPQTRVFNPTFDRMLDDLSGTDGVTPAYRRVVWEAGQADDFNAPIYKVGSEKLTQSLDKIMLTVRSESTRLADLKLGLRHTDNNDDHIAHLNLSEYASNITFSKGTDIGPEWSVMTLDIGQWTVTFPHGDALSDSNVVGFHLYSKGTAGSLDIQRVACESTTSTGEILLQDFAGNSNIYWDDSEAGTYTDIGRQYEITSAKQIVSEEATSNNTDSAYGAIVLSVAGTGTVTVAPVKADGSKGEAKAWSALKDLNGVALPAIGASAQSVVVSLDSLGEKAIKGVEITVSGGTLSVYGAFFTNMEDREPEEAPRLDVESISYLSKFNFEYKFPAEWTQAGADAAAQFGFDYAIAYHNDANVAVSDGHLVFDATGNPDYINAKLRSKTQSSGKEFLVIKYRLEGGATMDEFRFDVIKTDPDNNSGKVVYFHDLVASFGTPSKSTPYFSESGYSYLVVDVAENFAVSDIAGVDLYYTGSGKLYIDEIFYADAPKAALDTEHEIVYDDFAKMPDAPDYYWTDISAGAAVIEDGALKVTVPAGTAVCVGGAKGPDFNNVDIQKRYMIIRMKGDLGMETFRITWLNNETNYFNAGGFKTLNDVPYVMTDEYTDFVIDLYASGIDRAIEGFRLWLGGWNAEAGTVYIDKISFADALTYGDTNVLGEKDVAAATGYNYLFGQDKAYNTLGKQFVEFSVSAPKSFDFTEFRLQILHGEDGDTQLWNAQADTYYGKMTMPEPAEGDDVITTKLVFDLKALGINPSEVKQLHAHMNEVKVAGHVKIEYTFFDIIDLKEYDTIIDAIPVNDDAKPVIDTFEVPASGTVGKEISVTVTASDNYSAAAVLNSVITVTRDGNAVAVSGGKFTPDQAGTYTVTVKVTDEAGNEATASKAVTVSASSQTDPEPGDSNEGLPTYAIVLIVVGVVAVIGGVVACVIVVRKRKNK